MTASTLSAGGKDEIDLPKGSTRDCQHECRQRQIERAIEDQRKLSEVISTAATALSVIVRLIGIVGVF